MIRDGGVGVQASLAGFGAAFDTVATGAAREALAGAGAGLAPRSNPEVWAPLLATLPAPMREHAAHGVVRLLDYQDAPYARQYVDRLQRLAAAAGDAATQPTTGRALAEAARLLALWMTYEDVIRVANLKSRRSRVARIRSEAHAKDGEILEVVEYLKPGVDEVAAVLPHALGARLRDWAIRRGKLDTLNRGMHLPSSRIHGYLMLRLLARLRPMRRRSLHFTRSNSRSSAGSARSSGCSLHRPPSPPRWPNCRGYSRATATPSDAAAPSFERIFDTLVERALN